MEFRELVRERHSIRDFKPDPVPRELIQQAIEAAVMAPSAMNSQPWHFYVATGAARAKVGEIISQSTIHLSEYMDALGPRRYEDTVKWYSYLGEAPVVIGVGTPEVEGDFNLLNKYISLGCSIENLILALTRRRCRRVQHHVLVLGARGARPGLRDPARHRRRRVHRGRVPERRAACRAAARHERRRVPRLAEPRARAW